MQHLLYLHMRLEQSVPLVIKPRFWQASRLIKPHFRVSLPPLAIRALQVTPNALTQQFNLIKSAFNLAQLRHRRLIPNQLCIFDLKFLPRRLSLHLRVEGMLVFSVADVPERPLDFLRLVALLARPTAQLK